MIVFDGNSGREDRWVHWDGEGPLPTAEAWTAPLAQWLTVPSEAGTPKGVRIAPDADVTALAPWVDRLDLVVIEPEGFKDGRMFSLARLLRTRLEYRGEIRARGPVLADQFIFLRRSGFDTVEIEERHLPTWRTAAARYRMFYQASWRSVPVAHEHRSARSVRFV